MQISHPNLGSPCAIVTPYGELVVTGSMYGLGFLSKKNSTSSTLLANGSFVGDWESVKDYSTINILAKIGASGTIEINYSSNALDLDRTNIISPLSGVGTYYALSPRCEYFRLIQRNGASNTGSNMIQTMYSQTTQGATYLPLNQVISDNFTTLTTKSVLSAKESKTGSYINIDCTEGGNLKISVEDWNGVIGSVFSRGDFGTFDQDESTHADVTIEYEHHAIHKGKHFNVRNFSTPLNSGATLNIGFTTPNGSTWTHLIWKAEGTTQTEFRTFEGATLSGGTTITPRNNNRNCPISALTLLSLNPVISGVTPTSGLLIGAHSKGFESATPARAALSADASQSDEWVLKSGTTYLFEFKSVGANNIIDYEFTGYNHADKTKQF